MRADSEPTVQSIIEVAAQAGLPLSEEEAEQLLPGVLRVREMARTARSVISAGAEPASVFSAAPGASAGG